MAFEVSSKPACRIAYKASVKKELKQLDKVSITRILDAIDTDLAHNPGKDKALKGQFPGLYSYPTGDWRVIYTILGDTLLILRVGQLREVYRPL